MYILTITKNLPLEHNGHTGIFVENAVLDVFGMGFGYKSNVDVYKCEKCGLVFTKLNSNYFAIEKGAYYYFWVEYSYPQKNPYQLWACEEKDRIIQEIIC